MAVLTLVAAVPLVARSEPAARVLARLSRLDAQLRASPDNARLSCEVGWLNFLVHTDDSVAAAGRHLDHGISKLGTPTETPLKNRLAACLYSRGRVHERQGEPDRAEAVYERSLALRPNPTVTQRLADLRARTSAHWRSASADTAGRLSASPDLARAFGATDPQDVLIAEHLTSPDGRTDVFLATVIGQPQFAKLALRQVGGPWSVIDVLPLMHPNGSEELELAAGVAPPGGSPTFVVRRVWDHRTCCDEEGMPDWDDGVDVTLAWQDAAGAWSVANIPAEAVTFTADGLVVLEPSGPRRPRESFLRR
jgi:hypothetical protein